MLQIGGNPAIAGHAAKFSGIRNGIDQDIWDPENDSFLPQSYDHTNVVEGKQAAREALRQRLGLTGWGDKPVIGLVSRLTAQKGEGNLPVRTPVQGHASVKYQYTDEYCTWTVQPSCSTEIAQMSVIVPDRSQVPWAYLNVDGKHAAAQDMRQIHSQQRCSCHILSPGAQY